MNDLQLRIIVPCNQINNTLQNFEENWNFRQFCNGHFLDQNNIDFKDINVKFAYAK